MCSSLVSIVGYFMIITLNYNCLKSTESHLVSKKMTHNICFILLAVDKENNNDHFKNLGTISLRAGFPRRVCKSAGVRDQVHP